MERGQLYMVDLPIPKGSEPVYRRPMLVVQDDQLNHSRLPTVLFCPLSSQIELARFPGNVLVKASESGLKRDSVILVHQMDTWNRAELTDPISTLPAHLMLAVDEGLRFALGL